MARLSMDTITRRYPAVTFTPLISINVRPFGTEPGFELAAGVETTVPNIVRDIHNIAAQSMRPRRQDESGTELLGYATDL